MTRKKQVKMSWLTQALLLLANAGVLATALSASSDQGDGSTLSFADGDSILQNMILAGPLGASLSPITTKRGELQAPSGTRVQWSNTSPNSVRVDVAYASAGSIGATFRFPPNDTLYGVWEYPWNGSISNKGVQYLDEGIYGTMPGVNWSNARAPWAFSKSGFGVYVDSDKEGEFNFGDDGQLSFRFNASTLSYSVMHNRNLSALLMSFMDLSSKIQLPPDSGYGPNFWSDDFEQDFHGDVKNAQENYYDVVNHLYYNQIRATAMFADRPYGTGNNSWGNFDFDPKYYPTPKQFIANLSTWGFDFQVWAANRAFLDTELYNKSIENGWFFPGYTGENFFGPALNLSIPEAYDYFLERMSYFPKVGVKGYKIDRGEEHGMPVAVENIQNPLFEDLCYKSMAAAWGEDNFYSFARSVFDRSRSQTAVWNGDSHADFTGLRYSIASGIRAGLLGFAQWGSDTGGYVRDAGQPSTEVYGRWMHFSAFSTMYEIRIGTGATPWYNYPESLMGVLKKTANLHTRLIPYIRSYVYHAMQTGLPVMRALFLEYPEDDSLWEIADEYAFGKELLVAPITSEGGSRSVYLPQSEARFLEFWNKTKVYSGGQTVNITDMSLEYSPVYIREGAIIPTGDVYQGNAKWDKHWKPYLEIELYPSYSMPGSTFTYYRGKEAGKGKNGTSIITATANKCSHSVTVEYNDLGIEAHLLVYTKNGVRNVTLPAGGGAGGSVKVEDVVTLFD